MEGNPTYQRLRAFAENYLQQEGYVSADRSASSKILVSAITKAMNNGSLDVELTPGTILSYISYSANRDNDSRIVSGGPHSGYWYEAEIAQPTDKPIEEASVQDAQGRPVSLTERDLYPLMELWLSTKFDTAKDTSTLKSGGKWGNPDIVGVTRVEMFGSVEIEVGSCEVKLSELNWEQFIFEAISHKRFANRSWFCYRVTNQNQPLPKGMEFYAERYKVGIVQVTLSDDELAQLKSSKQALDFIDRVVERVPALYEHAPLQEKRELLDRAKIKMTMSA